MDNFDILEIKDVIQHYKDLYNVADMLGPVGLDEEEHKFVLLLRKAGWSDNRIHELRQMALEHTRYENLIPSMKTGMNKQGR